MILNKYYERPIIYWIRSVILLLFSMIIVGGLTRLTDSGLSITQWELFKGILPPFTNQSWDNYFSLYKKIPQFELVNNNMDLNEFKTIFLWEYAHRMLGRLIGLFFLIPFIYFVYKKAFTKEYKVKFLIIFLLILLQGFIGWYMVQSGLVNDITVSHYRLSLHLLIAFIILSSIFWIYLNFTNDVNKKFFNFSNKFISIKIFLLLIFLQIVFGAFVSGLDAGKVYQTWPLMNDSYFPNDLSIKNIQDLFNFDNHSLVQFLHRNIAYLIFFLTVYIGYVIFNNKINFLYNSYLALLVVVLLQIILGIITLLSNLNLQIASLHQISSIFLVILSIRLYHLSIK